MASGEAILSAGAAAVAAEPATAAPPRRAAWATSFLLHALVLAALAIGVRPEPPVDKPLVRLVFAEPPPPPPAPPAPVAAPPRPVPQPVPVAKAPVRKPKPVPAKRPRPEPAAAAPVESAPAAAPEPVPAPAVEGGAPGGVAGGVPGSKGPVPVGEVARPPALVSRVVPEYPPAARRRGVEGLVRLEAVLDTQGRIAEPIRVLASVPDLDEAAVEALRKWRFSPARDQAGKAVAVILEVPIRFVLR